MPDRFGFNLLGETVRCIDCPAGGPIWNWPERKRWRHARAHRPDPRRSRRDLRRQRVLLAAPIDSYEEKEAITMATQPATKGEPAKQVALDVLRKARGPLHAKEIAKRVIASGRCSGLKGKTPDQTITAMLAVGSKPGGPFKRVDKSTYTLADASTGDTTTEPDEPEAPRTKATSKKQEQTAAA